MCKLSCSQTHRRLVALVLVLLCVGCTSLTPAGSRVRVTSNNEAVHGCTLLGEVKGADHMWGGVAGQGIAENNAWNELKNRAAAMGADTVLMVTSSTGFSGSRQIGEAYRCGASEDPSKRTKLSRIAISNFARQQTNSGQLVGSFDIANENDSAVMSLVVQCSIGGMVATNMTSLPALGSHQRVTTQAIAFSPAPFPDGAPVCRVIDVSLP